MTSEVKNERYVYQHVNGGHPNVIDTHTGEVAYRGPTDSARHYVSQHNAGHVAQFELWRGLATTFVSQALSRHPLPWSIIMPDFGANVVANDGTVIVNVDDLTVAGYVVKLASQMELEQYPDGRPRG